MTPLISAVVFILKSLLYLSVVLLILRFLVQAARVDYHNPIVQAIVKLTNPLASWLRAVFKALSVERHDFAALLVAWLLAALYFYVVNGMPAFESQNDYIDLAVRSGFMLVNILFDLYFFILIIIVIASWVGAHAHPALLLLDQLVKPILQPLRQLIPSVSGLDFSVLAAMLLLIAVQRHILPALQATLLPS